MYFIYPDSFFSMMSGSEIRPYFCAILSPNARETARPGPQLSEPVPQRRIGVFVKVYLSGCRLTLPPKNYILFFYYGSSGLWCFEIIYKALSLCIFTKATESPNEAQ